MEGGNTLCGRHQALVRDFELSSVKLLISALSCNASLGSEAVVGFNYAAALAQRHEVTVLASPPSQPPPEAAFLPCHAGPCSFNEVGPVPLLKFETRQWILMRKLKRLDFDLIHRLTPSAIQIPTWIDYSDKPLFIGPLIAAESPPAAYASFLTRPVSRPVRPRWHPGRVVARLCREVVKHSAEKRAYLQRASRILVGSRSALEQIPESLRNKCRSITYSGIEHEVFVPPISRPPSGLLHLLFVGRLVPYKGLELLLRAVFLAIQRRPMKLNICGNGDAVYKSYLMQLVRELGLEQSVIFLPPRSRNELIPLYQQADVFCFPTLCDTYGIALLEAMSCGCATIVSDAAAAGEIVDGQNGLKVALRSPEQFIVELADKMVALAQNREFRLRLGEAARQYILQEHDWKRIGQQLLKIYEEFEQTKAL